MSSAPQVKELQVGDYIHSSSGSIFATRQFRINKVTKNKAYASINYWHEICFKRKYDSLNYHHLGYKGWVTACGKEWRDSSFYIPSDREVLTIIIEASIDELTEDKLQQIVDIINA